MQGRLALAGWVTVVLLAGCTGGAVTTPSTPSSTPVPIDSPVPSISPLGTLPVDPALQPVSLSNMQAGPKEALTVCGLIEYTDLVAGMAIIDHPSDSTTWVPFYGTEPELRGQGPMWLMTTKGQTTLRAGTYVDPTCVVVDGAPSWIGTGGLCHPDGTREPPLTPRKPPAMRLPPLQP